MSSEAVDTAHLLTLAREALERFIEVNVDDDGALTFSHAGVPGVIQATKLVDGLTMLSLTCVLGWDLSLDDALPIAVAERAGQGLIGTLGIVRTDEAADLTLRYAFPAAGLSAEALGTLLMLVISTASQLRGELLGISSE